MRKWFLVASALVFGVVAAPAMTTLGSGPMAELSTLRAALDQLGTGDEAGARSLLESEAGRGALSRESALVLAHLQERDGELALARSTIEGTHERGPLHLAFLERLGLGDHVALTSAPARDSSPNAARPNAARLAVSDARIARLETLMFEILNRQRRAANLPLLSWDARLAEVSRAHSAAMRDHSFFAHESPLPGLRHPLDRYRVGMGTTPRLVAENVYRAWGSRPSLHEGAIETAHRALMDSPGHRANILLDGVTHVGIGLTSNAKGDIWITQMFSRSR